MLLILVGFASSSGFNTNAGGTSAALEDVAASAAFKLNKDNATDTIKNFNFMILISPLKYNYCNIVCLMKYLQQVLS
jgi:hypothetical protein